MKKRLIIIDGNSLVHRAFHALPPLTTRKGEPTGAIYGFLLVFFKCLRELKPDLVIATFDFPAPTFRHQKFKEYKATRPPAPKELYWQIEKVKEILKNFGICIFEKQGFEADDLIATLSQIFKKRQRFPKGEVIILSGDLDTLQLVDEQTKVYTLKRGIKETLLYDPLAVKEKYQGLSPKKLPDFKALKGEPSDNIPGVPGIGEKMAIKILNQFENLEELYQYLKKVKIPEKAQKLLEISCRIPLVQKLKEYQGQALFSRELATLKKDVPIDFDLGRCQFERYDRQKVIKILKELEFYSLIEKLPGKEQQIKENLAEEIEKLYRQGVFQKKIYQLEKNLIPVIEKMERTGIKIDPQHFKNLSQNLALELEDLKSKIYGLCGRVFNLNSSQQLAEILFKKLKLPTLGLKKTPGGVISTSSPELFKLRKFHPVIDKILQYRELFKLKSSFVDPLIQLADPKDLRIHPQFHQLGTVTGRISCSNPNLQQIPIRGKLQKEIRKGFVSEPGFLFLSCDYSQMELRVLAHLAKDKKLIEIFNQNQDIHRISAARVFKVKEEEVSPEMRDLAKSLNYGIVYGMGVSAFAQNTGLSLKEAQQFFDQYFLEFEGVKEYIEKTIRSAKERGLVETLFGRKRYLPEIQSLDPRLSRQAERMAINTTIQGTAADLIKMAMVLLDSYLSQFKDQARMVLQLHDELLFELKADLLEKVKKEIKEKMEKIYQLRVPLKVETKTGKNWGELS